MSSLIQKGFNIFIRTMAKPVVKWILDHKKTDILGNVKIGKIGKVLVYIGQKHNIITTKINRKIMGLSNISEIKHLTEEKALEKGTEFCSELIVYSILIFVPIIEWKKQAKISALKEKNEMDELEDLKNCVIKLSQKNEIIETKYIYLKNQLEQINLLYNDRIIDKLI